MRRACRAFNTREIDAATELMHPKVDWPNAWEGGRVVGRRAVQDYWKRQFKVISSEIELQTFTEEPGGAITVNARQVVHEANTGRLISDLHVRHRFRFRDGLIVHMDVVED